MARFARSACVWLAVLACASPPVADATGPIDWTAVADERVPVLVTTNPDGSERATKLWLVVVDGQGMIRTSNTRWFRNIERDPRVVLRIGGLAYPLRAEPVTDAALRERINAAFRDKYPFWDRVIHPLGAEDANLMRFQPRAAP